MIDLLAIEEDLLGAYRTRLAARRRRRKLVRAGALVTALASVFAGVAVAGGIGDDLELDPTKWIVVGSGSTDDGRGGYVHAERTEDGSPSTFMVEHDAGLGRYQAFLLHEQTKAAADASSPVPVREEPGKLCTADQLTHVEVVALQTLAGLPAATSVDDANAPVVEALGSAFAGAPCRGLAYAGEQARLVWAGVEPGALLMPGAR
jgi:hypothetical protein